MKTKYILLIVFGLSCFASNSYSQLVFLNQFSGGGGGQNVSNAMVTDANNNSYVTGYTTGILSGHDITTLKYDPSGRLVWSQTYNGTGNGTDEAYAITLDAAGNVYVAGSSTGLTSDKDMIMIKYNNNGTQQWLRIYSSTGSFPDEAYAITIDAANNPIMSGYSNVAGVGNSMTVVKYNPTGDLQWAQIGGLSGSTNVAYAITVDAVSNIYVTGYTKTFSDVTTNNKNIMLVKFSPNGNTQWTKTLAGSGNGDNEPSSMAKDASGNIYIAGYVTGPTSKDFVTAKYNPAGTLLWMQTYDNPSVNDDDMANKIIIDQSGNVLVTGTSKHSHSADAEDYMTIKYNGYTGQQIFASRFNNTGAKSMAYSIVEYRSGKYYVTGSSRQTQVSGSEDIVTLELRNDGTIRNRYRISNPGPDQAFDIKSSSNGNFVLSGYISNNNGGMSGGIQTNMTCAMYNDDGEEGGGEHGDDNMFGREIVDNVIALKNIETTMPHSFMLYQNYPNPFNPSTSIKFDVARSSIVKVALYDLLGREVLVPINEYMNAGTYEISVSLNNLASGLYFYKMTSGSFTDIKKMILTK